VSGENWTEAGRSYLEVEAVLVLAVVLDEREDVVDQLPLLHGHVGVGGGEVDTDEGGHGSYLHSQSIVVQRVVSVMMIILMVF
jgi:hypothetical protein